MLAGKTSISLCPVMWAEMANPMRLVGPHLVGIDEYMSMATRRDRSTNRFPCPSSALCAQADAVVATAVDRFVYGEPR